MPGGVRASWKGKGAGGQRQGWGCPHSLSSSSAVCQLHVLRRAAIWLPVVIATVPVIVAKEPQSFLE